jgi:hypothetical protein
MDKADSNTMGTTTRKQDSTTKRRRGRSAWGPSFPSPIAAPRLRSSHNTLVLGLVRSSHQAVPSD